MPQVQLNIGGFSRRLEAVYQGSDPKYAGPRNAMGKAMMAATASKTIVEHGHPSIHQHQNSAPTETVLDATQESHIRNEPCPSAYDSHHVGTLQGPSLPRSGAEALPTPFTPAFMASANHGPTSSSKSASSSGAGYLNDALRKDNLGHCMNPTRPKSDGPPTTSSAQNCGTTSSHDTYSRVVGDMKGLRLTNSIGQSTTSVRPIITASSPANPHHNSERSSRRYHSLHVPTSSEASASKDKGKGKALPDRGQPLSSYAFKRNPSDPEAPTTEPALPRVDRADFFPPRTAPTGPRGLNQSDTAPDGGLRGRPRQRPETPPTISKINAHPMKDGELLEWPLGLLVSSNLRKSLADHPSPAKDVINALGFSYLMMCQVFTLEHDGRGRALLFRSQWDSSTAQVVYDLAADHLHAWDGLNQREQGSQLMDVMRDLGINSEKLMAAKNENKSRVFQLFPGGDEESAHKRVDAAERFMQVILWRCCHIQLFRKFEGSAAHADTGAFNLLGAHPNLMGDAALDSWIFSMEILSPPAWFDPETNELVQMYGLGNRELSYLRNNPNRPEGQEQLDTLNRYYTLKSWLGKGAAADLVEQMQFCFFALRDSTDSQIARLEPDPSNRARVKRERIAARQREFKIAKVMVDRVWDLVSAGYLRGAAPVLRCDGQSKGDWCHLDASTRLVLLGGAGHGFREHKDFVLLVKKFF